MKRLRAPYAEVALASGLVLLNSWFVVGVVGISYGPFSWMVLAQPYMGESDCSDGIDNDSDNLVDCADPDCRTDPACAAPAPLLGIEGVVLALLVLVLAAGIALRRPVRDRDS